MTTKLSSSSNIDFSINNYILTENMDYKFNGFISSRFVERLDYPLQDSDDENIYYHNKAYWCISFQKGIRNFCNVIYAVPYKNIFENETYYGWLKYDGNFLSNGYKPIHPGDRDKIYLFKEK